MIIPALLIASLLPDVGVSGMSGPGRFCGYSPIIDLLPGERIVIEEGGIHAGSFRWMGAFGSLEVFGAGWAHRPKGRIVLSRLNGQLVRYAQRHASGRYSVAIWNGAFGAAFFSSPQPLTAAQVVAVDRVRLYQEGQTPTGCKLRTTFSWGDDGA